MNTDPSVDAWMEDYDNPQKSPPRSVGVPYVKEN